MSEQVRTQYYLSADEFFICCSTAGLSSVCGFGPANAAPSRKHVANALFSLTKRGLLTVGERDFTLCPELSECMRLIRDSRAILLVAHRQAYRAPCCLVYGDEEQFVSLQPGGRSEDYVGITRYCEEQEWLSDLGWCLPGNLPDDAAASMPEPEAELVGSPALRALLQRAAAEEATHTMGPFPEEILGAVESRQLPDRQLVGRLYLVRQPLFDRVILSGKGWVSDQNYRLDLLAEIIHGMRMGRMSKQ